MGLREIFGITETKDGVTSTRPAEWTAVGVILRDTYIKNSHEMQRVAAAQKRDSFYEGKGDEHIVALIQQSFKKELTRKLRADLVSFAKWNNVIRRVAHETATVYSEPARRRIGADDETYQRFLDLVNMDAVMRELDQKLVYHEDVWIQYRVRNGTTEPVIELYSPARFWAVCSPTDSLQLVAVILNHSKPGTKSNAPAYHVWTADEFVAIDSECRVIQESLSPNPLKRLPGVLATVRPASTKGKLLSDCPAADLTAAHETVWFQNVLLLKESKSANRQTYVTGDTSAATMGQTADTETEVFLPEGTSTSTTDRGMDLSIFRDNADHILERAAANHGLPPSVLHHQDSSSGEEIHLRRIPIRENRKRRIPFLRRTERELAEIQSGVNEHSLPEYAFNVEDWAIDYGEVQQPLTEAEADAVFEKRRQLGLTDTLEEIRRRNPDLKSDEQAEVILKGHVEVETKRVAMMRDLMALSGAMGSSAPSETDKPQGEEGKDEKGAEPDTQDSTTPPQFRKKS